MSAGKAFSFSIGALLAAAVTVGLFIIMYSLIAMRDVNLDDDGGVKIADIQLGETKIEAQLKEIKPDKPEDPEVPPPEMPMQPIRSASTSGRLQR